MHNEDWLSPSEDESDAVSVLALHAAAKELEGCGFGEEHDGASLVLRVIAATQAAENAVKQADKDFQSRNPDKKCHGHYGLNTLHIVASAFWAAGEGVDISDTNPSSRAGAAILDFAAAVSAMSAISTATTILSEGGEGLFGTSDARSLLQIAEST